MPYVPGKAFMLRNMGASAIVLPLPGKEKVCLGPGERINLDLLLFRDSKRLNKMLLPFERSGAITITTVGEPLVVKQAPPAVVASEPDKKSRKAGRKRHSEVVGVGND